MKHHDSHILLMCLHCPGVERGKRCTSNNRALLSSPSAPVLRGKRLVETMQLCYHRNGKRLPPCIQAEGSDRPTKKVGVEAHDGGKRPGQSVRQTRRAKEQGAS